MAPTKRNFCNGRIRLTGCSYLRFSLLSNGMYVLVLEDLRKPQVQTEGDVPAGRLDLGAEETRELLRQWSIIYNYHRGFLSSAMLDSGDDDDDNDDGGGDKDNGNGKNGGGETRSFVLGGACDSFVKVVIDNGLAPGAANFVRVRTVGGGTVSYNSAAVRLSYMGLRRMNNIVTSMQSMIGTLFRE